MHSSKNWQYENKNPLIRKN